MIAYDEDVVKSYEDEALNTEEAKRTGPGEQGKAVVLDAAEMEIAKNYINQNGFNTYISDKIAVDRSVGDIRLPQCKTMKYLAHLPSVSVVIPFFQEHWNVLLRTFITVLKRAPKDVIKEVILVDDGSWREHLLGRLDDYLRQNYPDGKVRVVRHQKREGLIRARITGAKAASGEILLFLDSHCEPTVNYLPPLIDPIVRNYRTVTCPFIDTIHADTFEYMGGNDGMRGVFNWELQYKGLPKLQKDVEFPERPFESPVMAGGLFAISAKWFWELGGYDPELQIWGGEQFEISFKLWQCGGSMFDIPCSHIGHIYRGHPTDFPNNPVPGDFIGRNFK